MEYEMIRSNSTKILLSRLATILPPNQLDPIQQLKHEYPAILCHSMQIDFSTFAIISSANQIEEHQGICNKKSIRNFTAIDENVRFWIPPFTEIDVSDSQQKKHA
jgi:hypothetical protein